MNHTLFLLLGLGGMEMQLVLALALYFGLIIWALVDVIRSDFGKDVNKLIWVIVIVCFPFLGSLLYLLIGVKQKRV